MPKDIFAGASSLRPLETGVGNIAAIKAAQDFQEVVAQRAQRIAVEVPHYEFLELIGKGSYGRVYKSRNTNTSEIVAVKVIDIDDSDYKERSEATLNDIQKEITALKTLKDANAKNVNMMHEAFVFDADVWLVSEYCTGGSLRTLMRAIPGSNLDEKFIIPIARELAEALKSVHGAGIIHRDVKSANVLINEDGHLQLCDFGVAGTLETKTNKRNTVMGTCHWMPPEMVGRLTYGIIPQGYGTEVDVWSYGCTLYELATGAPPNARVPQDELNDELRSRAPRLEGTKYSQGLRDLIAFCLQRRPRERPTLEQIQEHYYINDTLQTHPPSLLVDLLKGYKTWEKSGGERASLWMEGGAQVSELGSEQEGNAWTFDTVRPSAAESSVASLDLERPTPPSLGRQNSSSAVRDFAALSVQQGHARIPRNALSRLFDPEDEYNYAQRRRRNSLPFSDLPLREQTRDSQIQDTQIDLGDFDSVPDIVIPDLSIPDMNTIRASRPGRFFRDSRLLEDDSFGYQADEESNRRATKDWKFPSAPAPDDGASSAARRRTQDWTFPAMMAGNRPEPPLEAVYETASAPTSPPRTAFSVDDTMPRPASADPTAGALSPSSLDMDPFGLETSSDDGQLDGQYDSNSSVGGNRTSFHRQSRSEPSNLDIAAAEAEAAMQAASDGYGLAGESYPGFLRGRGGSVSTEDGDDASRRFHKEAAHAWLRDADSAWGHHSIFNPESLELPRRPDALNLVGPDAFLQDGQYPTYSTNGLLQGREVRGARRGDGEAAYSLGSAAGLSSDDDYETSRSLGRAEGGHGFAGFDPESLKLRMPLPPPAEVLVDGANTVTMETALGRIIGDLASALDAFQGGLHETTRRRR